MKKTIYLAGQVSGLPFEDVKKKFDSKANELQSQGLKVFNPVQYVISNFMEHAGWEVIMRVCIARMMDCDEVHMLPCWRKSRGARLERNLALRLGMTIVYHTN